MILLIIANVIVWGLAFLFVWKKQKDAILFIRKQYDRHDKKLRELPDDFILLKRRMDTLYYRLNQIGNLDKYTWKLDEELQELRNRIKELKNELK